jgi:hypothetical protein
VLAVSFAAEYPQCADDCEAGNDRPLGQRAGQIRRTEIVANEGAGLEQVRAPAAAIGDAEIGAAASAETKKWNNGWSAAATFEGEFSHVTESYAGKGVVRYAW